METESASSSALISFGVYLLGVLGLAWFAGRALSKRSFVSEYFLGSRNLGTWAFAMTFAATAASGGSFMGFPSLVYTHGWSLALWIAGYMTVPLVMMAALGKRLNQVARTAGAITAPEVLRERFRSPAVGLLATGLLLFFLFFFLVAQFKAGSSILAILLRDAPLFQTAAAGLGMGVEGIPWLQDARPDYLLSLLVFGISVGVYTTYGGFRAVVWTDVMQGVVMLFGTIALLVLTVSLAGGLGAATRRVAEMTPPERGEAVLALNAPLDTDWSLPSGVWLSAPPDEGVASGRVRTGELVVFPAGSMRSEPVPILVVTTDSERERIQPDILEHPVDVEIVSRTEYAYGAKTPGVYLGAPGPSAEDDAGFLALGMAFSFFVFWAFAGAGQPSAMVRLMSFKDSRTLKRSIITVSLYFSFIYFALVIIFVCARTLLPGRELESDRIMPELAAFVTAAYGVPWLAGIVVAAPFAAVMSSVDSFLLMLSSGVVRDIYQKSVRPDAAESTLKRLTYLSTASIAALAMAVAVNPPEYLQKLIVFSSGGLAVTFLIPVSLAIYWPRMNAAGAIAGMLSGSLILVALYVEGFSRTGNFSPYAALGLHSFIWGFAGSGLSAVLVALVTPKPDSNLVRKFFGERGADADGVAN